MRHILIIFSILLLGCVKNQTSTEFVQGTETFPDGSTYVGEWKNGKHHGQGTYTFHDGVKWVGVWIKSEPWNITKYDKDGKIYGRKVNGVRQ